MSPRLFSPIPRASIWAALALAAAAPAFAAGEMTARGALKVLPKGSAAKLARIAAEEGKPAPERWHFLVHDPKAENGLREFVVAEGELVADRAVSQFAEVLTADDVIGTKALKVDSDKAAGLARQYALANDKVISSLSYELTREGGTAAPVWKVRCLDDAGAEVGALVITAGKGNVVSHEGFPIEPQPTQKRGAKKADLSTEPALLAGGEELPLNDAAPAAPDEGGAGATVMEEGEEAEAVSPPVRDRRVKSGSASSSASRKQTRRRSSVRVPDPVTTVRRATAPARRVIRGLLPF